MEVAPVELNGFSLSISTRNIIEFEFITKLVTFLDFVKL